MVFLLRYTIRPGARLLPAHAWQLPHRFLRASYTQETQVEKRCTLDPHPTIESRYCNGESICLCQISQGLGDVFFLVRLGVGPVLSGEYHRFLSPRMTPLGVASLSWFACKTRLPKDRFQLADPFWHGDKMLRPWVHS